MRGGGEEAENGVGRHQRGFIVDKLDLLLTFEIPYMVCVNKLAMVYFLWCNQIPNVVSN
jgi:hypothetical protein